MNYIKGALESKTVWMGIVGTAAVVAGAFGYQILPADQASFVDSAMKVVEGVTAIGAIVFRINATHLIKLGGK